MAAVTVHQLGLPQAVGPATSSAGSRRAAPAVRPTRVELVALTHERGVSGALELHGTVRNPQNGSTLEGMTAVASFFDRQGAFVTSGRAPLHETASHDRDATFSLTLPDAAAIVRYRMSFRTADGIVPHIDLRHAH
jgi:hypothetical protein